MPIKLTWTKSAAVAVAAIAMSACESVPPQVSANAETVTFDKDPYPSTYTPYPSQTVLLRGATVLDGAGGRMDQADVLLSGGKIVAFGTGLDTPADAQIIDATGFFCPGLWVSMAKPIMP